GRGGMGVLGAEGRGGPGRGGTMSRRPLFGENSDLFLVAAMVGILVVLFTPIPTRLLDLLLLANFSFALLILLITFYAQKPVEFSTFPSLLLIPPLFLLSPNTPPTPLILTTTAAL